jgi:hypothetical protein
MVEIDRGASKSRERNEQTSTPLAIFMVVCLLIIGGLNVIPSYRAQASSPALVPEPSIQENHLYNETGYHNGTPYYTINERWSLDVVHGDVETALWARNFTQNNGTMVDYSNNIMYRIGNTSYQAQFMIMQMIFKIGGLKMYSMLKTCDEFELARSPVKYDGTKPTFDCNITYERIRVGNLDYQNVHKNSTFDVTLFHHFRLDWNQTDIKVEALFNFNNTRFYQVNGTEFDAGEPFTAEIVYSMALGAIDENENAVWIVPTSINDTTMEYNLTLDNGSPLKLSKLEMRDSFTIQNGTGAQTSVGYSSMETFEGSEGIAQVIHGFPNLTYKDTQTIRSDPEITIYHDRVTGNDDPNLPASDQSILLKSIAAIGVIGAIGMTVVLLLKRKKKKKQEKDSGMLKKP